MRSTPRRSKPPGPVGAAPLEKDGKLHLMCHILEIRASKSQSIHMQGKHETCRGSKHPKMQKDRAQRTELRGYVVEHEDQNDRLKDPQCDVVRQRNAADREDDEIPRWNRQACMQITSNKLKHGNGNILIQRLPAIVNSTTSWQAANSRSSGV